MDIKDIKAQLSITQVLQHYGLRTDKNNKLCCPFHEDKSPSLQIYPQTNTYCCFSANCKAATGDAIQFIQLKENCTKHEALTKATALLNNTTTKPSATDIKTATGKDYVFAMKEGTIYIYTTKGVVATIPISTFKK
jgi:DNA primase